MVLGVYRRVLGDAHAAEDAFQATFVILARKAGSIREQQSLASWLYGVAFRVARDARDGARRRLRHERKSRTPTMAETSPTPSDLERQEYSRLLHELEVGAQATAAGLALSTGSGREGRGARLDGAGLRASWQGDFQRIDDRLGFSVGGLPIVADTVILDVHE